MEKDVEKLRAALKKGKRASRKAIDQLRRIANARLPHEYLEFMKESDGAEGAVGERGYLVLYTAHEVLDLNRVYWTSDVPSWLFVFGGDGGCTAYAFDLRSEPPKYLDVALPGFHRDPMYCLGQCFAEFLESIASQEA